MSKPILLIGAGGHASVLLEILKEQGLNVIGYVSPDKAKNNFLFQDLVWFKSDSDICSFATSEIQLLLGIGSLPGNSLRFEMFSRYKAMGYDFLTIVSSSAIVSGFSSLQEGVQVLPGAIINVGTRVGLNTIVNSGAIIEHDCIIGDHNHIAPGVVLSGGVETEEKVHIGTGASVIQSITIKKATLIASGAVVTRNTTENMTVYPCRSNYKKR